MYEATVDPVITLLSAFFRNRPSLWDPRSTRSTVLGADWRSGFYSVQECRRTSRRSSIPCP